MCEERCLNALLHCCGKGATVSVFCQWSPSVYSANGHRLCILPVKMLLLTGLFCNTSMNLEMYPSVTSTYINQFYEYDPVIVLLILACNEKEKSPFFL